MKFAAKIFNLILLAFTFCLVTFAEWGVYNLTALPSGTENTIGIVSRDTGAGNGILEYEGSEFTAKDDNIAYFDTFSFLGTDVAESVQREPRYMIRGWFKWQWWQNGMAWADKVAECVIGAVVPIFAPTYEASQVKTYFSEYRGTAEIIFKNAEGHDTDLGIICRGVSDELVPGCPNYLLYKASDYTDSNGNGIWDTEDGVVFSSVYRVVNGEIAEKPLIKWHFHSGTKYDLIHNSEIRRAYNSLIKINKYNSGAYDSWANKFLSKDVKGNYVVKQAVSALYFQFYLAIVFSIWFVYQNPIVFEQNSDGTQTMRGGIHWHHRRHGDKPKKDRKHK